MSYRPLLLSLLCTLSLATPAQAEPARTLTWDDLMPADYTLTLEDLYGSDSAADALDDDTSQARQLLDRMHRVLASAPVVSALDGQRVRLPGYVVPLAGEDQRIDRFFLVPYFGACIHTPPPPANQIVDTHFEPGTRLESLYDAVWVTGTLTVENYSNELGTAGYRLEAVTIEPYEEETEASDPQ